MMFGFARLYRILVNPMGHPLLDGLELVALVHRSCVHCQVLPLNEPCQIPLPSWSEPPLPLMTPGATTIVLFGAPGFCASDAIAVAGPGAKPVSAMGVHRYPRRPRQTGHWCRAR